jgi:very-short-patch-repair endonuclease
MARVLTDDDFCDLAEYRAGEQTNAFRHSILALYQSGVSASAIARFLGRDKSVVKRILHLCGQELRSNSAAQKTLNSLRTAEERKAATLAANKAWRDREWTSADSERLARNRFRSQHSGPDPRSEHEGDLFNFLTTQGIQFITQVPVGAFNIDFVIGNLAIEINGGSWHNTMRSRDQTKVKAILDRGYRLLIIQCPTYAPLYTSDFINMIAHIEQASRNKTPGSQYWVFMGNGQFVAELSCDGDDLPFIPESKKQFRAWRDQQGAG